MTIRQNNWTLGTFCESYCRVVTQHHTLEDHSETLLSHFAFEERELVAPLDRHGFY